MVPFQNPTIYIGSCRIDEPISSLTDIILSLICLYAYYKTKSLSIYTPINLYRFFFLFTGLSTLVAAIVGHAFLYHFGSKAKIIGWILGMIGASFAQFAAIYHTRKIIGELIFKRLIIINIVEIFVALLSVFIFFSFIAVEIHTAYCLLLNVVTLEFINYKRTKSKLSIYIIYGISLSIVAVVCFAFKLAFSVWFNHIDLSHVCMSVSMYIIYKGIASYCENYVDLN